MGIADSYIKFNATSLSVVSVSPSSYTDHNESIVDTLVLTDLNKENIAIRFVNTRPSLVAVSVELVGSNAGTTAQFSCTTLACGESDVNTWTEPGCCSPKPLAHDDGSPDGGDTSLALKLPPFSFSVCHSPVRRQTGAVLI